MRIPGPKSIRGQLIASFVLFELVALVFFSALLLHERSEEVHARTVRRLESQTATLAQLASYALGANDLDLLQASVASMMHFPTIQGINVTDLRGQTLAASDERLRGRSVLSGAENSFLGRVHGYQLVRGGDKDPESVWPVWIRGEIVAYLWVHTTSDPSANLGELLRAMLWGALAVVFSCTVLAMWLAGSLTSSLTRLIQATRSLIRNPEDISAFPLKVRGSHEVADLTSAFNLMVSSIEEERSGLNDTLALMDSMLANAPVGLAFFDRNGRFVRINRYLAEQTGLGAAAYLGRHIQEVFPSSRAALLADAVRATFEEGRTVSGLEMEAGIQAEAAAAAPARTWLINVYPVRTANQGTRWAGVVMVDMSERLRVEHALRENEKLAMAGRLAASIAHEINNPLEAVTNLLYLLSQHGALGPNETEWAEAAQHEVARVSAITQQTLRFHRQSTRPVLASTAELLDSVLTLHQGRFATLNVGLERRYRDGGDLFCYAGELRQLFANLVGNGLDALMSAGGGAGRMIVGVRASRAWREPSLPGVRVVVADTGCGMSREVLQRIFEPFYTTKEATGTGLGLWVGAEIMAKHRVGLRIRSRERRSDCLHAGTVFMLFFPSTLENLLTSVQAAGVGIPAGTSGVLSGAGISPAAAAADSAGAAALRL